MAEARDPYARLSLRNKYDNLFPRFLNGVTTMAKTRGSLRERLAWVVGDVTVFADAQMPLDLLASYREFRKIVWSPEVPEAYKLHPHPAKSTPAFHLSWQKAGRAAELLTDMFETIAYRRDWTEEELQAEEPADAT